MAFTSSAVWQVQTDGSDTLGGGGFDAGVAGFPTDGAATLATSNAPVFTSASYTFVAGDVGAFIYIKSGTNWTSGWYLITSVSAGAATLNAAVGAVVLGTMNGLNTVAGCATTASPTAATWGIDYSQSATSRLTFTDMVIAATTTNFTSAANPVGKNFVGNIISNTSGTGWTVQRVAVVSTSGTTATCDKTLGTAASTGGNGRMGGALASGGLASGVKVAGNIVYVKAGTYSITSATTGISGGAWDFNVFVVCTFVGYSTVRTKFNTGTRPLIQWGAASITLTSSTLTLFNFDFDGNSQTTARFASANGRFIRCSFTRFNAANQADVFVSCTATVNSATVFKGVCIGCEAWANTSTPFVFASNNVFVDCLSYSNTGASTDGFSAGASVRNCVAYANGRNGFTFGSSSNSIENCHSEGNSGVGYSGSDSNNILTNSGSYNNTGGRLNSGSVVTDINSIALTTTAFTDASSSDFSLNNTAGGGALLRAAGALGLFPRGLTRGYGDVGATQHADPASVTVPLSRMFAGF